jgi:hypothetical protein
MTCPFCGYPRADGIQTHAWDCEWCTLLQRIGHIEAFLAVKDQHGSSKEPTDAYDRAFVDNQRAIHEHTFDILGRYFIGDPPPNPFRAHPNASPAEPARSEADSAEPGGAEPERAG